jgi:hypothetical protein
MGEGLPYLVSAVPGRTMLAQERACTFCVILVMCVYILL